MPRPRSHPRSRQAADALVRTGPLVGRWIERLLAGHEPPLSTGQYLALRAIADGDVTGVDLARRAAVSPAAVSQLVAALETRELVTRGRAVDDRRRQPLALTDQGRQALTSAQSLLGEQLAQLLAGLAPPEVDALTDALERLDVALSGAPPPRRQPRPPRPPAPPPPPRG